MILLSEKRINKWLAIVIICGSMLCITFEFCLDRIIVKKYPLWMSGHRTFLINVLLSIVCSAVITMITTHISFSLKRNEMEQELKHYVIEMRKAFTMFWNELRRKRYSGAISGLKIFEDYFEKFTNCYYGNGCTIKKYEEIEKFYYNSVSEVSTELITYNAIRTDENQNDLQIMENLRNAISEDNYKFFLSKCDAIVKLPEDDKIAVEYLTKIINKYFNTHSQNHKTKKKQKRKRR